jgi:hypothetical protein
MPLRNVPPEVRETTANLARMSRIVIQAVIPPELLAEAGKRLRSDQLLELVAHLGDTSQRSFSLT